MLRKLRKCFRIAWLVAAHIMLFALLLPYLVAMLLRSQGTTADHLISHWYVFRVHNASSVGQLRFTCLRANSTYTSAYWDDTDPWWKRQWLRRRFDLFGALIDAGDSVIVEMPGKDSRPYTTLLLLAYPEEDEHRGADKIWVKFVQYMALLPTTTEGELTTGHFFYLWHRRANQFVTDDLQMQTIDIKDEDFISVDELREAVGDHLCLLPPLPYDRVRGGKFIESLPSWLGMSASDAESRAGGTSPGESGTVPKNRKNKR